MEITKEEFEKYEDLRESGKVNMCLTGVVINLTGLEKEQVLFIMENYDELSKKYL